MTAHANGDLSFFIKFHIYCQEFKQVRMARLRTLAQKKRLLVYVDNTAYNVVIQRTVTYYRFWAGYVHSCLRAAEVDAGNSIAFRGVAVHAGPSDTSYHFVRACYHWHAHGIANGAGALRPASLPAPSPARPRPCACDTHKKTQHAVAA